MQVRAGDKLPISAYFSIDWEPIVPTDVPTVTIERRNLETGTWDTPVSAANTTVLASGLVYYDYTTASGYYEYVVTITTTMTTVDQQDIVLDRMMSGGSADDVSRILGLVHENVYIDTTVYDANNNLTSARLRIYSDAASVGTTSNVIGTYTITVTASGVGKFTNWKMVKV